MLARVLELLEKRRFLHIVGLVIVTGRDRMDSVLVRRMRGCIWVARRLALEGVHGVIVRVYGKRGLRGRGHPSGQGGRGLGDPSAAAGAGPWLSCVRGESRRDWLIFRIGRGGN